MHMPGRSRRNNPVEIGMGGRYALKRQTQSELAPALGDWQASVKTLGNLGAFFVHTADQAVQITVFSLRQRHA